MGPLGCISLLSTIALGAAAGAWEWSFWWAVLAALVAGSFSVSNGPSYDLVITANNEGRFGVMPRMIAIHTVAPLALAGFAFWAFS